MGVGERNRRYWSRMRIAWVLLWLPMLFIVPFLSEHLGWVAEGAGFIPAALVLTAGVAIFLDKLAFRVGVAIVLLLAVFDISKPYYIDRVFRGLDDRMQDAFFSIRGPKKPTGEVVIVDIDGKSLETLGQWPWPRTDIAQAMRILDADGAKVIGFDIVFPEKDRLSLTVDNDVELGKAFHDTGAVAGGFFITDANAGARQSSLLRYESKQETRGMIVSKAIVDAEKIFPGIRQARAQVINVPEVQSRAYHQGAFNIVPDQSGAARRYTMLMQAPVFQETLVLKEGDFSGQELLDMSNYATKIVSQMYTYPSLALEMFRVANGYDEVSVGFQAGVRGVFLDNRFIPLDYKGDIALNFLGFGGRWQPGCHYGPEYYVSYYSLSDVIQQKFPEGAFKNKYVLIGSSDPTLSDLVGSPFRAAFPGVEVHATMLDNLISEDYLVDYGEWALLYRFLGILSIGIVLTLVVAYTSPWVAGLTSLGTTISLPTLSYWCLAHTGIVFSFVYLWLGVILLVATVLVVNFFVEGRERRFVAAQFSKMVSPDVLHRVREDPQGVTLSGQRANVSVMFAGIAGFSTMAEVMPPKRVVKVLNDVLTPMTDILLHYNAFVDKFIGDAIMACWGVPFPDAQHAVKACFAALDQQEKLKDVAQQIKDEYGVDINVRMGISSGEASAAMMGSEKRKNYTVIGDTVNFSARLEPACRDYGVGILISESTYNEAKEYVEARCVDKLIVKGKKIPALVYHLLGRKENVSPSTLQAARLFEEGLRLHWQRQWDQAIEKLQQALAIVPDDQAAVRLIRRIEEYRVHPPAAGWDGSFVRAAK